jgi:hypothetical protein
MAQDCISSPKEKSKYRCSKFVHGDANAIGPAARRSVGTSKSGSLQRLGELDEEVAHPRIRRCRGYATSS